MQSISSKSFASFLREKKRVFEGSALKKAPRQSLIAKARRGALL
jgi:hypothetical protein